MKINIVCYENRNYGILGKFATKMEENINKTADSSCTVSGKPDSRADINHHIIYYYYNEPSGSVDTLMVTHLDTKEKYSLLKKQLSYADKAICMSKYMVDDLSSRGFDINKITFINPAHDGVIKPKKLRLGVTAKVYADGRKKERDLLDVCKGLSNQDVSFFIMGSGWEKIVRGITEMGYEVEYSKEFDYNKYVTEFPGLDYYLYWAWDEGSMGFIDAVAAGVKTIVTPQGYHLDVPNGITHSIQNSRELLEVLKKITVERKLYTEGVANWTWENYTEKHLELWKELLLRKTEKPPIESTAVKIKTIRLIDRIKRYASVLISFKALYRLLVYKLGK